MNFLKKLFSKNTTPTHTETINKYESLRNMIFNLSPEKLKLNVEDIGDSIYGVIMEQDFNGTSGTLIGLVTGDVSFYLESGAIIRGGFKDQPISEKAKIWVKSANEFSFPQIKEVRLPEDNSSAMYFISKNTIYGTGFFDPEKLNDESVKKLFLMGQELLSVLRSKTTLV